MTEPLVSVIVPVYNCVDFLHITLESVRAQDYPNLEIIAIEDGSQDGSFNIIETFSRSWSGKIKILTHPDHQNHGIAASYQLGIEHCQGEYIAFLEHDDVWQANKISEQVKPFERFPEVGVVFSDVYPCDAKGKTALIAFKPFINRPPTERPFDAFLRLTWGNFLVTFSNIMVRRSQVKISDIINSPQGYQDWMFSLQLASRCKFYHSSKTKIFWRQRQGSYYAQIKQMGHYRKLRKKALKNAIDQICQNKLFFCSNHNLKALFYKSYWYLVISLLSAAERIADYSNRRLFKSEISPFTKN